MISNLLKRLAVASAFMFSIQIVVTAEPITKQANEIFSKWIEWQMIMPDKDLTSMTEQLDGAQMKQVYVNAIANLTPLTPVLEQLTASYINSDGFVLRSPIADAIKHNFGTMHKLMEHDMPAFIETLRGMPFCSPADAAEESTSSDSSKIIDRYNAFLRLLFAHQDQTEVQKYLFSVANRFFEYCFETKSFPVFERFMMNIQDQPLGRMLYSVAWFNLAGNGWKHWHEKSLQTLKTKADEGKTIKYIAGGSDILQMLRAGIYNIKNIDPQLPSQPIYYANGWEFLVRSTAEDGGIGDKIIIPMMDRTLIMERTGFSLTGETFKARLNNDSIIQIPRSITTWTIRNENDEQIGQYQLDRRFCVQEDFKATDNEQLLMSFNELYFISLPQFLNGWMIEPNQFPEDLEIVIKQLRKPVSRDMVFNMRIASLLNATDFKFIALGTCIN
ncbi:hypothetical protein FJ365_02425 [Candidatus Dependentiae bacterium]|nr:hypothetical protein [Candidatus Dependentiae bacterium]